MKIDKKGLDQLVADLKSGLPAIYGECLKDLYVYRSYALGKEDEESDLDILVVLKHFDSYAHEVDRTSDLASSLSLKYEITISKVFIREVDWLTRDTPFLSSVREEAIPL
jgi:predicted nucleotidyltransferase